MSEPNTTAAAASTIVAGSLVSLFPQYILIIGGGLGGALWALWGADQMTRAAGLKFVARALIPAVVFASGASEFASFMIVKTTGARIELHEAFAPMSFLIAVFHRQAVPAAWKLILSLIPSRTRT